MHCGFVLLLFYKEFISIIASFSQRFLKGHILGENDQYLSCSYISSTSAVAHCNSYNVCMAILAASLINSLLTLFLNIGQFRFSRLVVVP